MVDLRRARADVKPERDRTSPVRRWTAAIAALGRSWIVAIAAVVFALTALSGRYLVPDTYMSLASGRFVAQHGIPHREVWTIAGQGREWIDQQWLAHLIFYDAWRIGGYPLLTFVTAASFACAFAALAALIASRGVAPHRAGLWALAAFLGCMIDTTIRAQSLVYPLFVGMLWLLFGDSRRGRPSWELAGTLALLVVWTNIHGSVLMGAGIVIVHCAVGGLTAARHNRRAAATYVAAAAAASVSFAATPYGFGAAAYYRSLLGSDVVPRFITEWQKPSLHHPLGYAFFVAAAVAAAIVVRWLIRPSSSSPEEVAVLIALVLLASQGIRYEVWLVIAAAFGASGSFRGGAVPPLSDRFSRSFIIAAVSSAVAVVLLLAVTTDRTFERRLPVAAIAIVGGYLAVHPATRVLADDSSSSALLWLDPAAAGRVGFDSRLEQFRPDALARWMDYMLVVGRRWPAATHGYDVLLVARQNVRLVAELRGLPGWRRLYEDRDGLVLVRPPTAF